VQRHNKTEENEKSAAGTDTQQVGMDAGQEESWMAPEEDDSVNKSTVQGAGNGAHKTGGKKLGIWRQDGREKPSSSHTAGRFHCRGAVGREGIDAHTDNLEISRSRRGNRRR
jgi:hypothetical protein